MLDFLKRRLDKINTTNTHTHDESYGSLWDKNDSEYVLKLIRQRNPNVFEDRLKKVWNDHKFAYDKTNARYFEPLSTVYKQDLVVTEGLIRTAKLLTGQTTTSFTHFVSGTGSTAEAAGNTISSVTESIRVSMLTSGDRYNVSSTMKFVGYFGTASPTGSILQAAVADSATPSSGTIYFYTKYPSALSHTQNSTFYVLQQSVSQTAS